jgi:FkbM family methyltransferase
LQKRLQEIPNVCVYNCALGDSSGKISLYANDFSPCSSILEATDALKRDWPEAANAKKEWIKVCRLDDVLSDVHLKPEMLVKIDVQGYEREVIRGGKGILRGSKVVVIEVNYVELYKGEPTFDDIYSEMKNLGFAFRGTVEQEKSRIDHRVIFADAIFENTSERE